MGIEKLKQSLQVNRSPINGYGLNDAFEKVSCTSTQKNSRTSSVKLSGDQLHLNYPCLQADSNSHVLSVLPYSRMEVL